MNTYKFHIDRKCTVYFREYHEIEARSQDEANFLFKCKYEKGDDNSFIYQEMLDDTITDTNEVEISDENFNKF